LSAITAAVIGLGRIASLLEDDTLREKPCTHTGAIAANPDCSLVAGCDIDGKRRRLYTKKWRVPVYADAAEMVRVHKPQILVVATHPDSHYQYCRLAGQTGVPLVICEKPLADTIHHACKIAGLAGNGLVIITNHERRYSADYIRAREIIEPSVKNDGSGRLGRLLSVRAQLFMGKTRRLVDVLWHDGTHLADAIMFLTGMSLKHRQQWGAQLSARVGTVWLHGELCGGDSVPVVLEIGTGRDHLVFEIEFSFDKGRLRIGNGVFEIWESAPSPYAEKFCSLKQTSETFEGPTGYFANMLADAVACLREPGRKPRSSAADGLRVIEYLNSVKPWSLPKIKQEKST
jgi:predicted dehydrogenase